MNHAELNRRLDRWRKVYDPASAPMALYTIGWYDDVPVPPVLKNNCEERREVALRRYEIEVERLDWLHDDTIPCLWPRTGTQQFAEAFGCPVHYYREETNPAARPLIETVEQALKLKTPHWSDTPLVELFEMADWMRERTGPDAIVRTPDIQSPMDVAALIWEKMYFYPALITDPEAVLELIDKAMTLITEFLDDWFARYGTSHVAHFPAYYMEGGLTLSEDEIGVISPEMFEQFCLPTLTALSERYGGIGIHCCADSRHQWANFAKVPGLRLLNLSRPKEQVDEALVFFSEECVQMHNGEKFFWNNDLPSNARVVMQAGAQSRDRALELSDRMRERFSNMAG